MCNLTPHRLRLLFAQINSAPFKQIKRKECGEEERGLSSGNPQRSPAHRLLPPPGLRMVGQGTDLSLADEGVV